MRFIHLADVHLGAVPDRGCSWSSRREEEIWETFRRVIAGIRENPVDLLFIAGDLFHRQPLLRELKEVNNLFSSIPDTRVYLMAGNHDYLKENSFYRGFQWSSNVFFFEKEELTCVKDEKLDVYIYGLSYEHQEIEEPLYDSVSPRAEEGIHILLAHGGDAKHIPVNMGAVSGAGFDYIALGHLHEPQILIPDKAAYAGTLEPVDREDMGPHGYMEGELENGSLKTRFVPFACRSYEQITLMLREDSTQASAENMLKADLAQKGRMNIYKIFIRGNRTPGFWLLPEKLKTFGIISEVVDESRPSYDLEMMEKQYSGTLIGDYIRYFPENNRTETEEKALYYGIQALMETGRFSGMKGEPEKEAGYSLDLERPMQMLKMSRKGFLVQQERRRRDEEGELQKLLTNVEHVQREMNTLKGNLDQIEEKENSLHMRPGDETGVAILDRKTERARKKRDFYTAGMILSAVLGIILLVAATVFTDSAVLELGILVIAALGVCVFGTGRMKGARELQKRGRMKAKWLSRQQELKKNREELQREYCEREVSLGNLQEEYREYEDRICLTAREEIDIKALNLAMGVIKRYWGDAKSGSSSGAHGFGS